VHSIVGSFKPRDPRRQRRGSRARSSLLRFSKHSHKSIDLEPESDVVACGAEERRRSQPAVWPATTSSVMCATSADVVPFQMKSERVVRVATAPPES
jgi:hypothetical protein